MAETENRKNACGRLFLCATPIGNLEDITLRVLRTLREADLIAAEDTRNSIRLLNHFDIHTPLTSYHEYNKIQKAYQLAETMQRGKNVALITDAGMPGISDPGEDLVRICHEKGIEVTALPGACACVTALAVSGLPTRRFAFEAFLPEEKKERKRILSELPDETRTILVYSPPHHLLRDLGDLRESLGNRRMAVCRELTKIHETVFSCRMDEAMSFYRTNPPKGEFVLVIEGKDPEEIRRQEQEKWSDLTIEAHMGYYTSRGADKKTAMKQVAKDRGVSKREIYQALLENRETVD